MFEHHVIDNGDVDDGKADHESSRHRAKQKLVLPHRLENGQWARVLLGMHVEQRPGEVLRLPCRDQQQKSQRSESRRSRPECHATLRRPVLIATLAESVGTRHAVCYAGEGRQTETAHGCAVDELVDNQLPRENANLQVVRRTLHHVRLSIFETETEGEEGGGDEIGPEDFEG